MSCLRKTDARPESLIASEVESHRRNGVRVSPDTSGADNNSEGLSPSLVTESGAWWMTASQGRRRRSRLRGKGDPFGSLQVPTEIHHDFIGDALRAWTGGKGEAAGGPSSHPARPEGRTAQLPAWSHVCGARSRVCVLGLPKAFSGSTWGSSSGYRILHLTFLEIRTESCQILAPSWKNGKDAGPGGKVDF